MTDKPVEEPKAAMAIVARFDGFVNYLYPMLTNTSRQHRVLRDTLIEAMFAQYKLFHNAGKSNQASRLFEADAGLAYLRELLRFMAGPDRWLVHQAGINQFARYMDDVVVIGHSFEAMALLQLQAQSYCQSQLGLTFSYWSVQPWQRGVNFCGYRIWPTHKLLRKSSVQRAKNKLQAFDQHNQPEHRAKFLTAWRGHAQWADSHNLLNHLGVLP